MPSINDLNKFTVEKYGDINFGFDSGIPIQPANNIDNGGANPALNKLDANDLKSRIIQAAKDGNLALLNQYEDLLVHTPLQEIKNGQQGNSADVQAGQLVNNLKFIETAKYYAAQNPNSAQYVGGDRGQVLTLDQINNYYGSGKYTDTDGNTQQGLGTQTADIAKNTVGGGAPNANLTQVLSAYNSAETVKAQIANTDPGQAQYKYNESTGAYDSITGGASISAEEYAAQEAAWTKATGKIGLPGNQVVDLANVHYDGASQTIWASLPDGSNAVLANGTKAQQGFAGLQATAQAAGANLGEQAAPPSGTKALPGLSADESGTYSWNDSKDSSTALTQAVAADNAAQAKQGNTNDPPIYIGKDAEFAPLLERAGIAEQADGTITSSQFASLYNVLNDGEKKEWDTTLASVGIGGSANATRGGGLSKWATLGQQLAAQYVGTPTGTSLTPNADGTGVSQVEGEIANTKLTKAPTDYLLDLSKQPGVGALSSQAAEQQLRAGTESNIRKLADAYGIDKIPGGALSDQVDAVVNGTSTMEQITKQYQDAVASRYPGIADQIKAGKTLRDVAGTAISDMANTLELNPDEISLNDPTIQKYLTSVNGEGKLSQMPRWNFVNSLKADPRYQYTNQAYNDYANLAAGIAQTFGNI